jgi:hypothetical protein
MRHTRWLALLLAGVGPLAGASPANAQRAAPKKTYIHFQTEGDLSRILSDKLLEQRLRMELFERFRNNKAFPFKFDKLDPKHFQDPRWKQEVEKVLNGSQKEHPFKPDEVERLKKLWNQAATHPGTGKVPDPKKDHDPPVHPKGILKQGALPAAPPPPAPEPVATGPGIQEKLAEWAREVAENFEHTRFGEQLRNSEEWQEIMRGWEGILAESGAGKFRLPGDGLGQFGERLRLQDWDLALPDLGRLKLPTPSLPRPELNLDLPHLDLGGPSLGGGLPDVGAVGVAAGQGLLWAVLAALVAVLLWRLGARAAWQRRGAPAGWQLGPWPVDPAHIATRADLVRAFEYLALLRLGPGARAWNHCEIAGQLGGRDSARGHAAGELASLYEQARYAPDDEPLAPADLDAARRNLCLLAGVATA